MSRKATLTNASDPVSAPRKRNRLVDQIIEEFAAKLAANPRIDKAISKALNDAATTGKLADLAVVQVALQTKPASN